MENSPLANKFSITIDGKTFWLKIGLQGIIYLQSLSQYDESDVFVASIITLNNISVSEANRLYKKASDNFSDYLPLLDKLVISFLFANVRDLYSKAVGEIGISPELFFQMSPDEIELAYEGYLKRKELEANLFKLAMAQALAGDHSKIQIVEPKEYAAGTLQERELTFSRLGRDDGKL